MTLLVGHMDIALARNYAYVTYEEKDLVILDVIDSSPSFFSYPQNHASYQHKQIC
ncbi:hypothetical protein [Methanococcoides sp. FTZ1]|uniref:hypothetical protein n=1 Tax=Methanococcoides sp. FTZ1 TaxID=3439061 RepID=UPI003F870534